MRQGWGLVVIAVLSFACGPGPVGADEAGAAETETEAEAETDTETETETETDTETETETGTETETETGTETETDTETEDTETDPDLPQRELCEGPDVIVGDLALHGYSALQEIEGVRCITGDLTISDFLEPVPNVAPLWALEVIGGMFTIGTHSHSVDSLVGLERLSSVGGLRVKRPPGTNLDGLESLERIGEAGLHLDLATAPDLVMTLANVDGLIGLTDIDGDLRIQSVEDLGGLASLIHVGGDLWITNNPELLDLDGLASLAEFAKRLVIGINDSLVDISGLAGVQAATEVHVFSNPKLSTCAVLELIAGLEPLQHRFVAGNDDEVCQPAEPCAAMDATGDGPCEALVGTAWNGQFCSSPSGCGCVGKDCIAAELWFYNELGFGDLRCESAFDGCL